jgi:HNH endonuclease
MDEHFRQIEEFPGYRVSRDGEVQSCWGKGYRNKRTDLWFSLKLIEARGGYLAVNLSRGGKKSQRFVHRLVLEAFVGLRPPGLICCHGDGNRNNNHLENLRWDTYLSNSADMLLHGTRLMGSAARSKLSEDDILEIRRLRSEGTSIPRLATAYDVSPQNIQAIVYRRSWRHLHHVESETSGAQRGQQGSGGSSGTLHSAQTSDEHASQTPMQQPQARTPQRSQV